MRNDPFSIEDAIEHVKGIVPPLPFDRHEPTPWYGHFGFVEKWFGEPTCMARLYNANMQCVAIVPCSVGRQILNAVNGVKPHDEIR